MLHDVAALLQPPLHTMRTPRQIPEGVWSLGRYAPRTAAQCSPAQTNPTNAHTHTRRHAHCHRCAPESPPHGHVGHECARALRFGSEWGAPRPQLLLAAVYVHSRRRPRCFQCCKLWRERHESSYLWRIWHRITVIQFGHARTRARARAPA